MKFNIAVLLGSVFMLFACSSNGEKTGVDAFEPNVVASRGYVVPQDSLSKPEVVPAGKPTIVKVGKTEEFPGSSNIRLAIEPKDKRALKPAIIIMGENGFELPKSVEAIQNPIFCKAPEVVLVKDAYIRDVNPQNFSSFSKLQGLRSDQVRCMTQDKMGNIWLGTDDGATKYDGKYFSHYTTTQGLKNSLILSIFRDKEGNIWFGTSGGGVTRYDGRYLTNFTTKEGFLDNSINSIFEDNAGNYWFGTTGGAVKFDGKYFTNFTKKQGLGHNDVRSIIQDDSGKIWISSNGGGISIFDGKSLSNYSEKEGLIQNFIGNLFKDKDGSIWLGSASKGLMKFDGSHFIAYSTAEGLGNNLIRSINQDDEGSMWFGTLDGGATKFDGKYFTNYTVTEGLSSNTIRSSLNDKNGNLWFGTRGGGLSRFDGKIFSHLTVNEGLSNSRVMSILQESSGTVWLGTFGGYVTKYSTREVDGIKQKYYSIFGAKEGLLNTRIYTIIKDKDGNIWFGSDGGGISKFDGKTNTTYTQKQGLPSNLVRKIYQDTDGYIWIATYGGGVSKFDGKNFINYSKKQGLSSNNILSILQDSKGNLWFGTYGGGVTCFNGKDFVQYTKEQGFFNNTVYSIIEDNNGLIWFGTGGDGIIKYDGKSFTRYSEDAGLNNSHILSLFQDSHSNIWAGSRFGANILNAANLENIQKNLGTPLFRNYNYDDGFIGIGCNLGAISEDNEENIWFGTTDRLTAFHPEKESSDTTLPNLQITNIQLFNEDIPWTDLVGTKDTSIMLHNGVNVSKIKFDSLSRWYGIPQNLSLSNKYNYLTFKFVVIAHRQTKKISYQYMLEGLDNNWNVPTDRTEISYGNLKYGHYTFKVKAINSEGVWSKDVNLKFSIRPPWWKTVWFYLVLVLLLCGSIYSFINIRERKLKLDKQILQNKVNEQTHELTEKNHELKIINSEKDKFFSIVAHDLRNPFNGFIGLTQLMADELQDMTSDQIQKIAVTMRSSASNLFRLLENLLEWTQMQQGLIPFDPEEVKLQPIVEDSISKIHEQAKNKDIEITVEIPSDLNIFADWKMLQNIIRNLISNAVKFTPKGGKIIFSAKATEENGVEISVKDSGIGMNSDVIDKLFLLTVQKNKSGTEGEPSTGLGLIICKDFVEKHGGRIWAESEEGKGSTFYFTMPTK